MGAFLVGFASDAGVARNKGRVGAKQAPNLIRQALANMAWHNDAHIADLGDIECNDGQLEVNQKQCASVIANALATNKVITLGGGHEVAWASFQGLAEHLHRTQSDHKPKIGIVNFDAHFDLREFESDIADIKQCTLEGGPDHIHAARFLSQFLSDSKQPWLHVDLSSSNTKGGLGAAMSDVNGFGVRFGFNLIQDILKK